MYKVVRGYDYNGYNLSSDLLIYFVTICRNKNLNYNYKEVHNDKSLPEIPRHHPALVETVEYFNKHYPYRYKLKVEEIPCDMYYIEEYDGYETVVTNDKFVKIDMNEFKNKE